MVRIQLDGLVEQVLGGGQLALLRLQLAQEQPDVGVARILLGHFFGYALRLLRIVRAQGGRDPRVQRLHGGRQLLDAGLQRLVFRAQFGLVRVVQWRGGLRIGGRHGKADAAGKGRPEQAGTHTAAQGCKHGGRRFLERGVCWRQGGDGCLRYRKRGAP
ncbi:hypothetical protein D3C87_1545540 [compost metagenome]